MKLSSVFKEWAPKALALPLVLEYIYTMTLFIILKYMYSKLLVCKVNYNLLNVLQAGVPKL